MNFTELIGILAGIFTTISFLPQVILIYKTKETKDLSLGMFSMFTTGIVLWLIYGFIISSFSIIIANGITFFLSLYILIMKIKHG